MEDEPKTLLVTLTGKDRPGVTSAMFDVLAAAGVEVVDIEQIVLRRRLLLGILVYPVLVLLGWRYVRSAERNERDFADLMSEIDR